MGPCLEEGCTLIIKTRGREEPTEETSSLGPERAQANPESLGQGTQEGAFPGILFLKVGSLHKALWQAFSLCEQRG